jgi:hypothetical protein
MLLGFIVAHKYAVVLTDRRLLVFRWSGMFMGHIRDIFIAAAGLHFHDLRHTGKLIQNSA